MTHSHDKELKHLSSKQGRSESHAQLYGRQIAGRTEHQYTPHCPHTARSDLAKMMPVNADVSVAVAEF